MTTCSICSRPEGSTKDRCGNEDGVPLGPVGPCEVCGRLTCPDCQHEADCCFAEADDHMDDPLWCPVGWEIHEIHYQRVPRYTVPQGWGVVLRDNRGDRREWTEYRRKPVGEAA
jgi:hypothetical protein